MTDILWRPSEEVAANANVSHFIQKVNAEHNLGISNFNGLHEWSVLHSDLFWKALWEFGDVVGDLGDTIVTDVGKMPGAEWFPDSRLNFAENLLRVRDDSVRIMFEREDHYRSELTSNELYNSVSRVAQAMRDAGVGRGDRVACYMPNIPETLIAMLATCSIGAVWSSCSPDFGVNAAVDRFGQIEPKLFLTVDGYFYNGKSFSVIDKAVEILSQLPTVGTSILVPYRDIDVTPPATTEMTLWASFFDSKEPRDIEFERVDFNDPLFVLFTSGTTGPPKCIVHGVGGILLTHLREHLLHNDVHAGDHVFGFTTTGWMMWNWLVSTLACRAVFVAYDGSPTYPDANRLFDTMDTVKANLFCTSAKFIDASKVAGLRPSETNDLGSLNTMLTSGSALVPENFDYIYEDIKSDLRVSSVSGGTDICGCFVMGCPILPVYRGEIQCKALGMDIRVFDENGKSVEGEKGELVCANSFPSMPLYFWNDEGDVKYHSAYFEEYENIWCQGDFTEITKNGGIVIYGRSDTVLNPGGIRIGTAEIYNQLLNVEEIEESCIIGQDWENDTRVVLFVCLKDGVSFTEALSKSIKKQIRDNTTPRHVPALVIPVDDIPRTTNGKVAELAVRNQVHRYAIKNRSALANPEALELFSNMSELQ